MSISQHEPAATVETVETGTDTFSTPFPHSLQHHRNPQHCRLCAHAGKAAMQACVRDAKQQGYPGSRG
jgi:hypothetical protein